MQAPNTDIIQFKIGNLTFPRVRNNFKYECKPIYTNAYMTQEGKNYQTFIRDQIVISNVNFDPCSLSLYRALCAAMNIGQNNGGPFNLTFFNFNTGVIETRLFIVKSMATTVLCVRDAYDPTTPTDADLYSVQHQKLQIDAVTFQEV